MDEEKNFCQISVKGLALTGAILCGAYLFLLAIFASWGVRFIGVSKELVELLVTVYPGYVAGFKGAVLGLIYGIIDGGITGALIAWLHNKFCK